jgi:anionic cell wall polymer biosynthesis LytR-Cps2A-Psr (LCP) family protein
VTSGTRASRRAAESAVREADQHRRRRLVRRYGLPAALVGLLVVGALVVGLVAIVGDDDAAPTAAEPVARTQQTLLVQLVPAIGQPTVANALTAVDTQDESGVVLTVPGRLVTDVPGRGQTTFDQTSVTADGPAAAAALADQLDVVVDGAWVLTRPALAALVDAAGGVSVDVDVDVTETTGGETVVRIPEGAATALNGEQAALFASFLTGDEPEQARLARFTAVFRELLRGLPEDPEAVRALLTAETSGVTDLGPDALAEHLALLRAAVVADGVQYPALPTVPVEAGDGPVTYRLDRDPTAELVTEQFAGSLPKARPGGAITVLVQNGDGTPGLAERARTQLILAGLTYEGGGNAAEFGYARSVVIVKDTDEQSRLQGEAVASALGLPTSAVRVAGQQQSLADVVVILGADFRRLSPPASGDPAP